MRAVVQEGADGQFYARFEGANGETWFVSEGYTQRSDAQRSILDFHAAITKKAFGVGIINLDREGNRV